MPCACMRSVHEVQRHIGSVLGWMVLVGTPVQTQNWGLTISLDDVDPMELFLVRWQRASV